MTVAVTFTECGGCGATIQKPWPVMPARAALCDDCAVDAGALQRLLSGRDDVLALYARHGNDAGVLAALRVS